MNGQLHEMNAQKTEIILTIFPYQNFQFISNSFFKLEPIGNSAQTNWNQ